MHNLYLISSSFIGIVILINFFARATQNNTENQNLNKFELSDENSNEVDALNEESIILEEELLTYPEITKNTFLYPDEEYNIVANEILLEKSLKEIDKLNNATSILDNEQIKTVEISKKKFLYPDDEFGSMERGVQF